MNQLGWIQDAALQIGPAALRGAITIGNVARMTGNAAVAAGNVIPDWHWRPIGLHGQPFAREHQRCEALPAHPTGAASGRAANLGARYSVPLPGSHPNWYQPTGWCPWSK